METVKLIRDGKIARVIMEDRESKNTFSEAFTDGLLNAFRQVEADPDFKVVILSGYDNYFCCGGTQEELLKIYRGESVFTKGKIYDLLLNCKIPVISAMQGHALGGGLVMGCYADIMILAKQCIYSTNFMKYGFTPGFGSTYIIPQKFGDLLGTEMLLTAATYQGNELLQRGAPVRIVDKHEVLNLADHIASELVEKPLSSLQLLKQHMAKKHQQALQQAVLEELAMHDISFKQPEVKEKIETLF